MTSFHVQELPWATVAKDSAPVLFTAFLALPDTLAGLPTALWLDTSQSLETSSLVWRQKDLSRLESLFLKSVQAMLSMDWLHAGQRLKQGLAESRSHGLYPGFLTHSGLLLLAVGEKPEGEKRLWKAAAYPGSSGDPARRNLVNLWLALGQWQAADSLLDVMLSQSPNHPFASRAKSFLLRQEGRDTVYEAFLKRQAISRNAPQGLRKAYGALLLEKGRYHEAAQMFQRAVESNPEDGDAWVALGKAFMEQELWIFAEESFRHGLQVGTRNSEVFDLYAQVLMRCCIDSYRPARNQVLRQAQNLLERGVGARLHNRSSAILLYDLYGLGGNGKAASALRRNLWFHFEGGERNIPELGESYWGEGQPARYLETAWSSLTYPVFFILQKYGSLPRRP